ncbi:hypothetical protein LTR37_011307 [Vermiconidia calcicola]|uniref:Uncharacterized protein n=1 Tax=Vermiconidia calcicola TaxID=1690605 RepID=A0ACC3N429_9PEZI|nr:hypothetical protein LTR37_011307 [Vermiconidia calcicola]
MRSIALYTLLSAAILAILILFTTYAWPHVPSNPWQTVNSHSNTNTEGEQRVKIPVTHQDWTFDHRRDARNYGLSEEQCNAAFPLLYKEIDRAVEHRKRIGKDIGIEEVEVRQRSNVRAMIRDNQLYVVDAHGENTNFRPRTLATLNSINRAVSAFADPLPDVEFTATFDDDAAARDSNATTLAYARLPEQEFLWLMPDFGFWGWPHKGTNSYAEHISILDDQEEEFLDKIPKLVWRGGIGNAGGDVRKKLIAQSEGHEWNDAKSVNWKNQTEVQERRLSMQEHCDYMFTAQTEGNTYSGRFKLLLNCHSVSVTHKMEYIEHFHHLLQPSGTYQNIVEVKRDFSDLPKVMDRLLQPENLKGETKRIADNARRTFRERYITPAAEACYWRALIRGWAEVQGFTPERWVDVPEVEGRKARRKPRGVPFEAYTIMETTQEWEIPAPMRHVCAVGESY